MSSRVVEFARDAFPHAEEVESPLFYALDGTHRGVRVVLAEGIQIPLLKRKVPPLLFGIEKAKHSLRSRIATLLHQTGLVILEQHSLPSSEVALFPLEKEYNHVVGKSFSGINMPTFWHEDGLCMVNILHRDPALNHVKRPHPTCFSTLAYIHQRIRAILPQFSSRLSKTHWSEYAEKSLRNNSPSDFLHNIGIHIGKNDTKGQLINEILQTISVKGDQFIYKHPWTAEHGQSAIFWSSNKRVPKKYVNDVVHAKELVDGIDPRADMPLQRIQTNKR